MTEPEKTTLMLSARIAALERDAVQVDDLQAELAGLDARREQVHERLSVALHAAHLLEQAQGHITRLLDGTLEPITEEVPAPRVDPAPADPPAGSGTAMTRLEAWLPTLAAGTPVTGPLVAAALGIPVSSAGTYLTKLARAGTLTRREGTGLPGVPSVYDCPSVEPLARIPLAPIPAVKLNPDEVSVLDMLRHAEGGLTPRLLQSRLNWGTSRTDKAIGRLLREGHLGHNGERLVVVPSELQGAQA